MTGRWLCLLSLTALLAWGDRGGVAGKLNFCEFWPRWRGCGWLGHNLHRPPAVIVDRLTSGGNITETGTDSYRLTHSPASSPQS